MEGRGQSPPPFSTFTQGATVTHQANGRTNAATHSNATNQHSKPTRQPSGQGQDTPTASSLMSNLCVTYFLSLFLLCYKSLTDWVISYKCHSYHLLYRKRTINIF